MPFVKKVSRALKSMGKSKWGLSTATITNSIIDNSAELLLICSNELDDSIIVDRDRCQGVQYHETVGEFMLIVGSKEKRDTL
jgi:hypothetical protein